MNQKVLFNYFKNGLTRKSISVVFTTLTDTNEKNYIIILVVQKATDKIKHPFIILTQTNKQ